MNSVTWLNILTGITAILGVVFGTGGLALGVLNYLRDRSVVKVFLQWNMEIVGGSSPQDRSECGLITVTNAGRRTVYISHVCLVLPKSHISRLLLMRDSVQGRKLSEGDPPAEFVIPHDVQTQYSNDLQRIRAQVSVSTGQIYLSKYAKVQRACQLKETS